MLPCKKGELRSPIYDVQPDNSGNYGATVANTPNSTGICAAQPEVMEPPLDLDGAMSRRPKEVTVQ